jgi:hypothetical protein
MKALKLQDIWQRMTSRGNTPKHLLNGAHNPKVIGSNPIPATKKSPVTAAVTGLFLFVRKW